VKTQVDGTENNVNNNGGSENSGRAWKPENTVKNTVKPILGGFCL
jgi:hypothetical protein